MFRVKLVLTVVLLTTSSLNAEVWSQNERMTLKSENVNLVQLFQQLQKQTNLRFVFNQDDVEEYSVSIDAQEKTLGEILDLALEGKPFAYAISENHIIISRTQMPQQAPQLVTITGYVHTSAKAPLAGVTVRIKGSGVGTKTDINGWFSFDVAASERQNLVLVFSCIGYTSQEVRVGERTELSVIMYETTTDLGEVVVTGYQTLSTRETASSTFSLKAADVIMDAGFSVDQMLQGHVPGMSVIMTSGEPSATPRIRIRGNATINGNKSPVWVVDGIIMEQDVPFTAADINSEDAEYLIGNAISGLNPQDIETITILKDASATAIYGVRAANGVIVITTKRGSRGSAPQIRYNGSVNLETRESYSKYDRMNSQQRVQFSREMMEAGLNYRKQPVGESYEGQYQRLLNKEISASEFNAIVNQLQERNTDWFDLLFRTEISHNHSVNLSGGGEKASYYFSGGYNRLHGAAIKSESERINLLGKVNVQLRPWLDMEMKVDFNTTTNDGYSSQAGVNPFNYAYNTARTQSAYNADGTYSMYSADNGYLYNILNELNHTGKQAKNDNFNGMISLRAKLWKGLSYQGVFSLAAANTEQREWATEYSARITTIRKYEHGAYDETSQYYAGSALPYGGILDMNNTRKFGYTARNILEYKEIFNGGMHAIHAMGGGEISSNKYTGHSVTGYGWNPNYGEVFMPVYTQNFISDYAEKGLLNPSNTHNLRQIASFFGTAAYTFMDRYVINANIRSDGSNKFGSDPKYRWQPTWSVAGKWIISSESFMRSGFVDALSLRASYGTQGNIHDDATPYLITQYGGRNSTNGLEYHNIVKIPNTSLRWEKTKTWNVALDFSLLENRIRGSIDVYRKNTSDLITSKQVPSSTGQSTLTINSARMRNAGFEGFINFDLIRGRQVSWNLGINFGRNVNEVTLVNEEMYSSKEIVDKMLAGELAIKGDALGSLYAYRYAGLSAENGYPTFYSAPQYFDEFGIVYMGDPTYMELVNAGSIYPDVYGGFDTQISFKGLSLQLFFTYSLGAIGRLPSMYDEYIYAYNPLKNASTKLIDRWKQPGDEARTDIPALFDRNDYSSLLATAARPAGGSGSKYPHQLYDQSDLRVASTDYLKLKAITLAYRLPNNLIDRLSISALNLRFQMTNVFALKNKKWEGLDPESYGSNIPLMPTYSFTLDFTF